MARKLIVRENAYFDSVTLMLLSSKVAALPGIRQAAVMMGTPRNLELMVDAGLVDDSESGSITSNHLIMAFEGDDEESVENALTAADESLRHKPSAASGHADRLYPDLETAGKALEGANLAIVSVPGRFAAAEAAKALGIGLNVLLFSDNVALADEIELKQTADSKGLLMMGPDCGTAIINGIALGFANAVARGGIGMVAASGTGLQEATCLVDRLGGGVSQAIGTGGRDLSAQVGGRTTLRGIAALAADPATDVILVISKPADAAVEAKIEAALRDSGKPAILCVLGLRDTPSQAASAGAAAPSAAVNQATNAVPDAVPDMAPDTQRDVPVETAAAGKVVRTPSIEAAALSACRVSRPDVRLEAERDGGEPAGTEERRRWVETEAAALSAEQRYVRGLYTGGTLTDEAMRTFAEAGLKPYSNIPLRPEWRLNDPDASREHTFIDFGDDTFTSGRPHPMIDPQQRSRRLLKEAESPETAAVLVDCVLGYGSHLDPAGELAAQVLAANESLRGKGRRVVFIASVCGTDSDPQNRADQVRKLRQAGVTVCASNARAARLAADLAQALATRKESSYV